MSQPSDRRTPMSDLTPYDLASPACYVEKRRPCHAPKAWPDPAPPVPVPGVTVHGCHEAHGRSTHGH